MALPVTLVTLGGVPVQLVDQTGSVFPTTGTGSLVFNTTPTLVTPILGIATGTTLALGGATIGSNALAVTGASALGLLGVAGAGTAADRALVVGMAALTGTTIYGAVNVANIPDTVTTRATAYYSGPSTAASAFTLTQLRHFSASSPATFGAGSTVTSQYGFVAESTLTGAANNYGFHGSIASGSNRWNLYMVGTAANYLAGTLAVGGATIGTNALAVTGTAAVSTSVSSPIFYNAAAGGILFGAQSTTSFFALNNWAAGGTFQGRAGSVIGWGASTTNPDAAAPDTALSRISAGVIGVGTGAAGSAAGTLRATILEAASELRFVSGTRLISQADGRFSFSIWDGTSKSQLDVSTTDTFKFRNATNSSDANITAGTATFSGSVSTTGNYQFGTNQTVVEKGTNGALKIRNYGDTAGGIIDATTDGTFKFFGRDGTTPAPIQIGNTVNSVSPTSPNRTVTMVIGGTTYYLAAKTTND